MEPVQQHPLTAGEKILGVLHSRVFSEVIGGGQADFCTGWHDPNDPSITLSSDDRALLYGYFNFPGHLVEMSRAMEMLTSEATRLEDPVVLDLGCGPGTGGLALANALGEDARFTYIGVDRAESMLALGESLAQGAGSLGYMGKVERRWVRSIGDIVWAPAPGWRPVIIVCSYLLASPTVEPQRLLAEVLMLVDRIGRGPVLVLYTNSQFDGPNRHFPVFELTLTEAGFTKPVDEVGSVMHRGKERRLRYALFVRPQRTVLGDP